MLLYVKKEALNGLGPFNTSSVSLWGQVICIDLPGIAQRSLQDVL